VETGKKFKKKNITNIKILLDEEYIFYFYLPHIYIYKVYVEYWFIILLFVLTGHRHLFLAKKIPPIYY